MEINNKLLSDNKWLTFLTTCLEKLVSHKLSLKKKSQTNTGRTKVDLESLKFSAREKFVSCKYH